MDFSQLKRPYSTTKPQNPIEIFEKLPNLSGTPNDLWRGQTDALEEWHKNRKESDVLITLNTGAGKTLVGLLIAQSLVNEGLENVVYLCGTNDLVYQTQKEAEKIGIDCTVRVGSNFSNNLFETGKAFCITNYAALFNGLSVIEKKFFPKAIIFDDAHVAERVIRDSFTLEVTRKNLQLFKDINLLFEPHFKEMGKRGDFEAITNGDRRGSTIMAAPRGVQQRAEELYTLLRSIANDDKLKYPFNHLKDNLSHCSIVFADGRVQIAPPFLPIFAMPVFERPQVRRIYLSATLNYKSDIARAFGKIPKVCIEPRNDAGNGERLVLFASKLPEKKIDCNFVKELSIKQKVLIAVPSYDKAKDWQELCQPPSKEEFSQKLQDFRKAASGTFILVSRVDGIDLPHDTCRVMVLDELPTGASLIEHHQWEMLQMNNFRAAKICNQIVQLFGRINRGRNDYGAFIINGETINNWLMNERYLALLPELLRKQINLGLYVHESPLGPANSSQLIDTITTVLSRDKGWIDFYRDTIENSEVEEEAVVRTREIEEGNTRAALAEAIFMSEIWQHNYAEARRAIDESIEQTLNADTKLAGWHNLWLGMCLDLEGDSDAAQQEYQRARQRLGTQILIPKTILADISQEGSTTLFENFVSELVRRTSENSYQKGLNEIHKATDKINSSEATPQQHEEALRALGEHLGFNGTRPDNDTNTGPDVLWTDEEKKQCMAFELKTKKKEQASYDKGDINQGHGHLEWVRTNYKNYECLGLIFVGPDGRCSDQANPSEEMYHCELSVIAEINKLLIAVVEDLRRLVPSERPAQVKAFCSDYKWSLKGLFARLSKKKMLSMK
jgi:hypothetical protein